MMSGTLLCKIIDLSQKVLPRYNNMAFGMIVIFYINVYSNENQRPVFQQEIENRSSAIACRIED